jgi:putative ABC transport system permease protein
MAWLLSLALRELWTRRGRSLLSLLALALSVGLVVATGSVGALMQAEVAVPASLPGHPGALWIGSAYDADYDLPAGLAARVAAVDGVAGVRAVLRRPVRVFTPHPDTLTLLGVEPASYFDFQGLTLAAGALPTAGSPGLVALAPWALVRELSLGDAITVTTPAGDRALPIAGLVEVDNPDAARQGVVLYAPLDIVGEFFGLDGAVTILEVGLAPGASSRRVRATLEQVLGPAYVVSDTSGTGQDPQLWQRLVLGALVFIDVLTLLGSTFLVYAVFAAAARARRRQIGLLRAAGALGRQVLALLAFEALLLGLAGSALGLLFGFLFARLAVHLVLEGSASPALPPLPPGTLALAAALGLLGALAGALGPARRAAHLPPLVALYPSPGHPAPQWRTSLRNTLPRHTPIEVRLALANLARERGRSLLIVAALALILAMALGNVGVLSLLGEELAASLGRLSGGDYLVLPGLTTISFRELAGQDTSDVPPLDPTLLATLEDLSDQVWLMGGTTADVEALQIFPGQPTVLLDVEGYARMGGYRFEKGNWPSALEAFRRGPAVLLPPVLARRLGVGLDDQLWLDTPQGPVAFRVAGIGDSEFTTAVLDLADGAAYLGANEVNGVLIQLQPGADAQAVRRALLDAVQTHGGTLLPLRQATAQLRAVFRQMRLSIGLLVGIAGLVAGLGVINALLSSVAERRREIGLLRVVGATRRQVGRLVLVETAILGIIAALLGTALGWGVTLLFLAVARAYLGLGGGAASSLAAWWPLLTASALGLVLWPLLAMLGGALPARHAARLPPLQALYETLPS